MAVIILDQKLIEGKVYTVKVYRTAPGKLVTEGEKKKAERLDMVLTKRMKNIENEINNKGFLAFKGKKGKVLRLWWEVGKRLNFVMDTDIVPAEDREFIWRALYDHVKDLAPGPLSERAKRNPEASHFSYCYKLSTFPWDFVEMAGDWTTWSEFFDRKETMSDPRIINWLGEKAQQKSISSRQNWLRPLTKAIHKEFEGKDTTIFSTSELNNKLDKIISERIND